MSDGEKTFTTDCGRVELTPVKELRISSPPIWLLRLFFLDSGRTSDSAPRQILIDGQRFTRMMEVFFLPTAPTEELSGAFFAHIAASYDDRVDSKLNKAIIATLLARIADASIGRERLVVLDYGCGSGLAGEVVTEDVRFQGRIQLVGYDPSPEMLRQIPSSRRVGYRSLTTSREAIGVATADAALLVFVSHFLRGEGEVVTLSRCVKAGGLILFNMHPGFMGSHLRWLQKTFAECVGATSNTWTIQLGTRLGKAEVQLCEVRLPMEPVHPLEEVDNVSGGG